MQLSIRTDRQLLQARAENVRHIFVSVATCLRAAALIVETPIGAVATLLTPYRATHDAGSLRVELGNITARQELQLVFQIQFPSRIEQSHTSVIVNLTGNDDELQAECEITFRYVSRADHAMTRVARS